MRNSYVRSAVILVVMALILIVVAPGAAAEKTVFPCTEELVEMLDPGTWTYPGGNIHVRGMVQLMREEAVDPRGTGFNTVVVNANWDENFTGPIWGTFRTETDEGGLWEGHWNGKSTSLGDTYHGQANGSGIYAGMKLWVENVYGTCLITVRD